MKYLNRYKSFESKNNLISQIRDILIDLVDDGFKINTFERKHGYSVEISHDESFGDENGYMKGVYLTDDLIPDIEHLISFMKSEGYFSELIFGSEYEEGSIKSIDQLTICNLRFDDSISIEFRKFYDN